MAVLRALSQAQFLFTNRKNEGGLFVPPVNSHESHIIIELYCLNNAVALTVDRRCVDWFVLRQFRITGTVAVLLLMNNSDILLRLGILSVQCTE